MSSTQCPKIKTKKPNRSIKFQDENTNPNKFPVLKTGRSKYVLTLVMKEISRRRLLDSKRLINKPRMSKECTPLEKVTLPKLVKIKPFKTKDRDLEKYKDTDNPYFLPMRERIFKFPSIKRSPEIATVKQERVITVKDDIHDKFFDIIDGRPLRTNQDIHVHETNIRKILQYRTNAGYAWDAINKIDMFMGLDELREYNSVRCLLHATSTNFQKFLAYSYNEVLEVQMKVKNIEDQLELQQLELEKWNYQYFLLRSRLIILSDKFSLLSIYKGFLDSVSPVWWRLHKKIGFMGPSIYFKDVLIDIAEDDHSDNKEYVTLVTGERCEVFFKTPEDMMKLLDDERIYGLRYLQLFMFADLVTKPVLNQRDALRISLDREKLDLQLEVNAFEEVLTYYEDREKFLVKRFHTIINGFFMEVFSSEEVLKLTLCIEYLHEKSLQSKLQDYSLALLMQEVENTYMQYRMKLDLLDYKIVESITKDVMLADKLGMERALESRRLIREWELFTKALRMSFEPPKETKRIQYKTS